MVQNLNRTEFNRIIGKTGKQNGGPTIICVGGIHGNEPAGIYALERVFDTIRMNNINLNGELFGIAGNLTALSYRERFIDLDLNRMWTISLIKEDYSGSKTCIEIKEQQELLSELENIFDRASGKLYFLDLHTSGAEGHPFACVGDNLRNRDFAMQFPLPIVLGLEEQIDGALLEYVNNLGVVTMGVEGGQHKSEKAIYFIESVIWIALKTAGMISNNIYEKYSGKYRELREYSLGIPKVLEVRYRHNVDKRDEFYMNEGYTNFQKVKKDDVLAIDKNQKILAKENGSIILPLYQALGNDGFFITKEIKPVWLKISKILPDGTPLKYFIYSGTEKDVLKTVF